MAILMSQAITEVRALLDESTAAFWSDTQIQSWINQGCLDVSRRAENLWQEWNVNVTPLNQIYPFPVDFLNCHRAEFTIAQSQGQLTYAMEYRGINQMDEIWGILHALPAAWPQYFTIRGDQVNGFKLMMYPSPGAGGVLTVYYYRQAQFVATTQNIDVQPGWEDSVYDYAVFKAQRAARDPAWKDAFQMYEAKLSQMIDKTRNLTDLGEQITSGVSNWPAFQYGEQY